MAYNPVPTVTTGDLWTASNHNTYIRDNFAAGVPDIFEAKGDIAVATGPNAAARLPIGSAGQVLTVKDGLPTWISPLVTFGYPLQNSAWDGDSKSPGLYTITANTFHASIPTTAKALLMTITGLWNVAGSVMNVAPTGGTGRSCLEARSHVANAYSGSMGLVPLKNGRFDVRIEPTGPLGAYIDIWGYIP